MQTVGDSRPFKLLAKFLNSDSIFLIPVTNLEVADLINLLNPSNSVCPNSISIELLKTIGPAISSPVASLVNQSFQFALLTDKLKVAKVISLFKKGRPELLTTYRLVSLFPISASYMRN